MNKRMPRPRKKNWDPAGPTESIIVSVEMQKCPHNECYANEWWRIFYTYLMYRGRPTRYTLTHTHTVLLLFMAVINLSANCHAMCLPDPAQCVESVRPDTTEIIHTHTHSIRKPEASARRTQRANWIKYSTQNAYFWFYSPAELLIRWASPSLLQLPI